MTAVVVAGALANKPGSSGEAWVRMSWVRGLESLGLDVWFVEQLDEPGGPDPVALEWFSSVTDGFGLTGRATLLSGGEAHRGTQPRRARRDSPPRRRWSTSAGT